MFIYICQAPPCFQFTKKINNWNSEKVYLVVCGCFLVIRLLVVYGGLCWFLVVCSWFVVVACFSNSVTRLRMGLSGLNKHKFKHNFCDFLNPLCACNLEAETSSNYLLRCRLFQTEQRTLLNDFKEIDLNIIADHKNDLDQILLYENRRYRYDTNRIILLSTIKFCIDSKRFHLPLF